MKVPRTIEELEKILKGRWFLPEERLYYHILRVKSPRNRRRYVLALVKKLARKDVILPPDLIEKLCRV